MYYYPDKGWGVRAHCDIPAGAFIAFYLGQIVTEREEVTKNDKFLVALDFATQVPASRSSAVATSSSQPGTSSTAEEEEEEETFCIDGRRFGNVGRFFNHSCSPNMFTQVLHRESFSNKIYNVAFFTSRNIVAGEELVWDYKYAVCTVNFPSACASCGATYLV